MLKKSVAYYINNNLQHSHKGKEALNLLADTYTNLGDENNAKKYLELIPVDKNKEANSSEVKILNGKRITETMKSSGEIGTNKESDKVKSEAKSDKTLNIAEDSPIKEKQ